MNSVALLTPTYGRDLELCTLLCESVDRHVTSFSKHYLLVPDCDLPLFAHFESERRSVLPASQFLPGWLRPLPRIIQRKRRQFWWSLRAKPVSGWHVQQFLKIAATIALPYRAILHPRFGHRVLPRFRPGAFRISESDSAAARARRGHRRPAASFALGRDQPSAARIAGAALPAIRFHRPHHLLGQGNGARDGSQDRGDHQPRTGSRRCARPANSRNTCCTAISCRTMQALPSRHTLTARTQCISYWDQPKLGRAN